MKTFYSILQVPLRSAGHEQLNIGLLLVGDREIMFSYSEPKLKVLKSLIPNSGFNLLKSYLISLKSKLDKDSSSIKDQFSSVEFVGYLSDYNNNLLTFSKPVSLSVDLTRQDFKNLFEKFVYEPEAEGVVSLVEEPITIYSQVQNNLYPKIKSRVNIKRKVTSDDLKSLVAPVTVDFIGKNKAPVAGMTIDFSRTENTVVNSLTKFVSLIHALDRNDNTGGKYYVLGQEPLQNSAQHHRWQDMQQTGFIEFVDISDVERISDYINEHEVKPLFPEN